MGLADASLVAAAESLTTRRVFTVDRRDFDRVVRPLENVLKGARFRDEAGPATPK